MGINSILGRVSSEELHGKVESSRVLREKYSGRENSLYSNPGMVFNRLEGQQEAGTVRAQ